MLRRRWKVALGGFLSVMLAVVAVTVIQDRTYESSATFLIEGQDHRADLPALNVLERSGRLASRETEMALIRSRRVVGPAVDAGDLHVSVSTSDDRTRPEEVFDSFNAGIDAVPGTYEIARRDDGLWVVTDASDEETIATGATGAPLVFAGVSAIVGGAAPEDGEITVHVRPFPEAVRAAQSRIAVSSVHRDADLVNVTCEGRSAEQARWLCQAIADTYMGLRSELQRAEAAAAAEFLAAQTEIVGERLRTAEDSLRAYSRRAGAVDLGTQASEGVRQNAALWAQREQLRAERASLAALLARVDDVDGGTRNYRDLASFPTFLDSRNQTVPGLFATLVSLENERNELGVHRSENDVELIAIDQRIADVEGQLRSLARSYEQALATQIESLDRALQNSGAVLASIPLQQIETARLERDVALLEELHGFLQARLQEAEIAEAIELPSVRVVDRPYLPHKHSAPNEKLNLALGFLLASGFGVMLGLWQEATDSRFRERHQVEDETGMPVLSMVPNLKLSRVARAAPRLVGAESTGAVAIRSDRDSDAELVLESFRTLSADLDFVGQRAPTGRYRSVAVTSSTRGEGKTFTACNLAIVRARAGLRTLLIDGDLRGQGVSRCFRAAADSPTVSGLAENGGDPTSVAHSLTEVQPGGNLFVLTAGTPTERSADFFASARFRALLDSAVRAFDFVVIDTPPLNVVTDAASIAGQVEGVLVVVRGGVTDRIALDLTLGRLDRVGADVAGIVLNGVRLPSQYRTYSHRHPVHEMNLGA